MKKIFLFLTILVQTMLFTACGPSGEQALTYNDAIVDEQKLIMNKLNNFFEALSKPEDVAGIDNSLAAAQQQVAAGIAIVEKMDGFDGSTTLRDAALELFKTYQTVLNNELKTVAENYKLPADKYDDAMKTASDKAYDEALQKMDQALAKMEAEQKAFMENYKLEVK